MPRGRRDAGATAHGEARILVYPNNVGAPSSVLLQVRPVGVVKEMKT